METIHSKVAGVTFDRRQGVIAKYCNPGTELIAIPEPDNPHSEDGTAVGLWVPVGTKRYQVGYVRDGLSADVFDHIDDGGTVRVRVLEVTGGEPDKPTRGLNIEIELGKRSRRKRIPGSELEPAKPPGAGVGPVGITGIAAAILIVAWWLFG